MFINADSARLASAHGTRDKHSLHWNVPEKSRRIRGNVENLERSGSVSTGAKVHPGSCEDVRGCEGRGHDRMTDVPFLLWDAPR